MCIRDRSTTRIIDLSLSEIDLKRTVRKSYHSLINWGLNTMNIKIHDNTNNILFSGGIAGICSWLFTYPMDVIKTRIQSGETNTIYQSYIKGNLFRGLSVCLLRSFIVNSIGFFIYEQIN